MSCARAQSALRIKDSQLRVRQEEQPRCDVDTDDSATESISPLASTISDKRNATPSSHVRKASMLPAQPVLTV